MRKKIALFILSLLFITGCTCEYTLTIDRDIYYEDMVLQEETKDDADQEYLRVFYEEEYPIFYSQEFAYYRPNVRLEGNTYYDKSLTTVNGLLNASYKATFDNDSYKDSRLLKTAFKNIDIGYDTGGKYYYITLSDLVIFNASNNINDIKINIIVGDDWIVIKNNADEVNNNQYTWNFTDEKGNVRIRYQNKETYEDKTNSINDETTNGDMESETTESLNTNDILIIIMAFLGFIIILGVLIFINRKIHKK